MLEIRTPLTSLPMFKTGLKLNSPPTVDKVLTLNSLFYTGLTLNSLFLYMSDHEQSSHV